MHPARVLGVLAAVLLVAAVAIGVALAAPSTKNYDATIVQTAQDTYRFELTNLPSSTQTLGSANVTFPTAFSVESATVTAPSGKPWKATVNGRTVELRPEGKNSPLGPRDFIVVEIEASAACGAGYPVDVRVKQSNSFSGPPGNDFNGPNPLFLSVVGPAASFELTAPSPQVVDVPFDATVAAADACGEPAIYYDGSPTLSGTLEPLSLKNPTYGAFTFENGVGTASVTGVRSQQDAILTVTDSSVNPSIEDDSDLFDVVDTLCTHTAGECRAENPDGTKVSAPLPPQGASLALSLLRRNQTFTCGGTTAPAIGSLAHILPDDYPDGGTGAPIQMTLQLTLPTGAGNPTLCLSESKTFDGASFVPVPSCARTAPLPPCEVSRSRTGSVFVVTFLIHPRDPWAGIR